MSGARLLFVSTDLTEGTAFPSAHCGGKGIIPATGAHIRVCTALLDAVK